MSKSKDGSLVKVELMIAERQYDYLEEQAKELRMSFSDLARGILSNAIRVAIEAKGPQK